MSAPYLGQIKLVGFDFAPKGFALCSGQTLPINQNQALFAILGTTYGGNGVQTFALPDLRGRVPLHFGQGVGLSPYNLGDKSGVESASLGVTQIPGHAHTPLASSNAPNQTSPSNNFWAKGSQTVYAAATDTTLSSQALANTGGGLPHPNLPPYLVINFVIALQGIFPSRS